MSKELTELSEDELQELLDRVIMIRKADMIHSAVLYLHLFTSEKKGQACKEQRKICYQQALILLGDHAEGHEESVAKMIRNAPSPLTN